MKTKSLILAIAGILLCKSEVMAQSGLIPCRIQPKIIGMEVGYLSGDPIPILKTPIEFLKHKVFWITPSGAEIFEHKIQASLPGEYSFFVYDNEDTLDIISACDIFVIPEKKEESIERIVAIRKGLLPEEEIRKDFPLFGKHFVFISPEKVEAVIDSGSVATLTIFDSNGEVFFRQENVVGQSIFPRIVKTGSYTIFINSGFYKKTSVRSD